MAQKRKTDQKVIIIDTTLTLAAKHGWKRLSLEKIARECGVENTNVKKHFQSVWHIAKAVLVDVDKAARLSSDDAAHGNWRDNLMEMMLRRLEYCQPYRRAFVRLFDDALSDPAAVAVLAGQYMSSCRAMMRSCGVSSCAGGPAGEAMLTAIYFSVIKTWCHDDSRDMSKTMAAIDQRTKYLEYLDKL